MHLAHLREVGLLKHPPALAGKALEADIPQQLKSYLDGPDLPADLKFSPYTLHELGVGVYGSVYRVLGAHGRSFTAKVFRWPGFETSAHSIRGLQILTELTQDLPSVKVARTLNQGERSLLLMQDVPGITLEQYLASPRIPESWKNSMRRSYEELLSTLEQRIRIWSREHQYTIAHRSRSANRQALDILITHGNANATFFAIKPDNIMVGADGVLTIVDAY